MVLAVFEQRYGNKNRDCSVERQTPHSKRLNLAAIDEARVAFDGDHVNWRSWWGRMQRDNNEKIRQRTRFNEDPTDNCLGHVSQTSIGMSLLRAAPEYRSTAWIDSVHSPFAREVFLEIDGEVHSCTLTSFASFPFDSNGWTEFLHAKNSDCWRTSFFSFPYFRLGVVGTALFAYCEVRVSIYFT